MDKISRLESRIARLEAALEQLRAVGGRIARPSFDTAKSDIRGEIAAVKASGGDLISHFKSKARREMRAASTRRL